MKRFAMSLTITVFVSGLCLFSTMIPSLAANEKVIELSFAVDMPPMPGIPLKGWAEEVEKRTNGRVKVKIYWAQTLVKGKDMRRSTLKGVCDISFMSIGHDPSAYPLNMVMELPIMGFSNDEMATRIRGDIIAKFPELQAEYKGTHILWQFAGLPHRINTVKKPIRTPEDLKGLKIAAFGMNTKIADSLGASPVTLMPTDIYMALDRGVADGALLPFTVMFVLRLTKLVPYHSEMITNVTCQHIIMNARVWEGLPPDIKKIIETCNEWVLEKDMAFGKRMETSGRKLAEELGHEFVKVTSEEKAAWKKLVRPIHEKWIADTEAKGLPARAVYDEVRRLIKEYEE